MNWDDLRVFLAIADQGSLAGAARQLRVNHSTVFRRLNTIEEDLKVRLFERLPRGYVLTAAGEEMTVAARRVEADVADIERRIVGREVQLRGSLRVTTTEALAEGYLTRCIVDFGELYPEITVDLVVGYQVYDLSKREADVAIRPGLRPPDHLIARKLARLRWAVYAAPAYIDRFGTPGSVAELKDHRFVAFSDEPVQGLSFGWARELAADGEVVFTSNNLLVQRDAASAGIGLAVLPTYFGDPNPGLRRVFALDDARSLDVWLLTHPDLRDTARVKAFNEFILQAVKRDKTVLEGAE
ncbi:LysR family transcriptional regulator [Immundisolibacter sp.]|uniref:LysR family transcriptional regulator n=1 Tax=Immundisolibacter sp. TaxID=1934948 RepID=UPI003561D450